MASLWPGMTEGAVRQVLGAPYAQQVDNDRRRLYFHVRGSGHYYAEFTRDRLTGYGNDFDQDRAAAEAHRYRVAAAQRAFAPMMHQRPRTYYARPTGSGYIINGY